VLDALGHPQQVGLAAGAHEAHDAAHQRARLGGGSVERLRLSNTA
jgi:hypothetical protein